MNRFVEWWKAAKQFVTDVRTEMKNVSWPSKREVQGTTAVVLVAVFIFGVYLWAVDVIVRLGISKVFDFFATGA